MRESRLKKNPENSERFRGANPNINRMGLVGCTFFYPDYTVGFGFSPNHARFPKEESDVPKQARGLYHRSGIHPRFVRRKCHPAPKVIKL
jgi:hypothetical protein